MPQNLLKKKFEDNTDDVQFGSPSGRAAVNVFKIKKKQTFITHYALEAQLQERNLSPSKAIKFPLSHNISMINEEGQEDTKSFEKDQVLYENTPIFKKDSSDEKIKSDLKKQLKTNGNLTSVDNFKPDTDFSKAALLSERILP